MSTEDAIGVVRGHRWINADEQARRLRADGVRTVLSLGDSKRYPVISPSDLVRMARKGTVLKIVHAFLLVPPKRSTIEMKAYLGEAVRLLVDKHGGIIKDVGTGLTTERPEHRRAILAVANEMITRSCQGKRSAANGARDKGRPRLDFSAEQLKDAKAVWRNVKDYPRWEDAETALPEMFTTARAYKLWGKRI